MKDVKKSNWVKIIGLGFLYGIISYLIFAGGSVVIDAIRKARKKISTIILNPSEEYSDKKTVFAKVIIIITIIMIIILVLMVIITVLLIHR